MLAAGASASFGVAAFSVNAHEQDGSPDVQAGSHPFAVTTGFYFNEPWVYSRQDAKDTRIELPRGFVGNPDAVPRCPYATFSGPEIKTGRSEHEACPDDTVLGVATVYLQHNESEELNINTVPVVNLEPPPGVAAEFGFKALGKVVAYNDATVRTGGDYGVTVSTRNITQSAQLWGAKVSIWGVPADPRHGAFIC